MNHPITLCRDCRGAGITIDGKAGPMMANCRRCDGTGLERSTLPEEITRAVEALEEATTTREVIKALADYHHATDQNMGTTDALAVRVGYDHNGHTLRRASVSVTFYLDT